jgi:hypothetical protein
LGLSRPQQSKYWLEEQKIQWATDSFTTPFPVIGPHEDREKYMIIQEPKTNARSGEVGASLFFILNPTMSC